VHRRLACIICTGMYEVDWLHRALGIHSKCVFDFTCSCLQPALARMWQRREGDAAQADTVVRSTCTWHASGLCAEQQDTALPPWKKRRPWKGERTRRAPAGLDRCQHSRPRAGPAQARARLWARRPWRPRCLSGRPRRRPSRRRCRRCPARRCRRRTQARAVSRAAGTCTLIRARVQHSV